MKIKKQFSCRLTVQQVTSSIQKITNNSFKIKTKGWLVDNNNNYLTNEFLIDLPEVCTQPLW